MQAEMVCNAKFLDSPLVHLPCVSQGDFLAYHLHLCTWTVMFKQALSSTWLHCMPSEGPSTKLKWFGVLPLYIAGR